MLAGLLSTTATVLVPAVIGRGVDAAADGQQLRPYLTALAVLAVVRFSAGFAYRYGLFGTAHRIEADLRNLVFARLTELSFSYWDRVQTGQIISRANSDVRSIQLLFAFGPLVGMQVVLLGLGGAAMVALSPPLTLVALAPLPAVLIIGARLRNRVFPLSWVVQARSAELATIVDENIQGAQVVRGFTQEREQIRLLARAAQRLRWAGTATADARARHAPVMEALPRLGLALVLGVGGLLAINGSVAVGDIVAFNAYVIIMSVPFRMIGFILIQWQRASAAALRVFEILDAKPEIVEKSNALPLPNPRGTIQFTNITFTYPTSHTPRITDATAHDQLVFNPPEAVLKNLSFSVKAGECVAIVGATASGKSTIARLLPRFYDPDSGSIHIDGHDVRDLQLADLRKAVSIAPDDPFLFATTIHENVTFAQPDADDLAIQTALNDSAADFVNTLSDGIQTEVSERGYTLSGGQRQRIAITRALLANPAVLILDDSTSAIDVETERELHQSLRQRHNNHTTILISHRQSTIALADRVLFLNDGNIAAEGTHNELLASVPAYAQLLEAKEEVTA